jgi:hypothetical protein
MPAKVSELLVVTPVPFLVIFNLGDPIGSVLASP